MKKRYSEEQIIKLIKQHETEAKVDDICRDIGTSYFMIGEANMWA